MVFNICFAYFDNFYMNIRFIQNVFWTNRNYRIFKSLRIKLKLFKNDPRHCPKHPGPTLKFLIFHFFDFPGPILSHISNLSHHCNRIRLQMSSKVVVPRGWGLIFKPISLQEEQDRLSEKKRRDLDILIMFAYTICF